MAQDEMAPIAAPAARLCRAGTWSALLTRDYLPRVHLALRWLWTPLGSMAMASFAALLCGLVLHPRGFVILFGLLTLVGLGVAWPWLSVRGLVGTLSFDQSRVREGHAVTARLSLRNRVPWSAWALVVSDGCSCSFLCGRGEDRLEQDETPAPALVCAPGRRTIETTWEFVPDCRGIYPVRPPRIASGFPFGVWEASRPLAVRSRLIVWPRTFAIGPVAEAVGERSFEGSAPRDRPGPSGDFLGVRPYRRGDSLRRIHWPQTARHDQLVVCELQRPAVAGVQVVLDTHPASHLGAGPGSSCEWAIRVAASLVEQAMAQGAEVEAIFAGRTIAPRGGSAAARRARILDALAGIEPEGTWTLDDLLELPACRRAHAGLRVIVTTDLGLRRSLRGPARQPRARLVILEAAAFLDPHDRQECSDGQGAPAAAVSLVSLGTRIDVPESVADALERFWRDDPRGS